MWFSQGDSTQYYLLALLEKWKMLEKFAVLKGKSFSALLTDLFQAFDCFPNKLLLAKPHAQEFSMAALRLIHSYFTNRKQRTKVNFLCSTWENILFGVPQESILGPLLFNIFLCDLLFMMNYTDFASYTDDNTPYGTVNTIGEVIQSQEQDSMLLKWFSDNQAGISKCHFLVEKRMR